MALTPGREVYRGTHCVVTFDLNRKNIAKIAMGADLTAAVHDLAEHKAKPYAMSISPRSKANHPHYQDSFVVAPTTRTIRALKRVAAILVNTSAHAAAVEWGNAKTGGRGHRILGRTLDHLNSVAHIGN